MGHRAGHRQMASSGEVTVTRAVSRTMEAPAPIGVSIRLKMGHPEKSATVWEWLSGAEWTRRGDFVLLGDEHPIGGAGGCITVTVTHS